MCLWLTLGGFAFVAGRVKSYARCQVGMVPGVLVGGTDLQNAVKH